MREVAWPARPAAGPLTNRPQDSKSNYFGSVSLHLYQRTMSDDKELAAIRNRRMQELQDVQVGFERSKLLTLY